MAKIKRTSGENIYFRRKIGENMPEMAAELIMRSASHGLAELVANSYDADAENVNMEYDPNEDTFILRDDGNGMTPKEAEAFYEVGDSPKLSNPLSPRKKRPRLGHFGVATLVLKSLADEYTLKTQKKGLETTVTESFDSNKPLTTQKKVKGKVTKVPRNQHGTTIEMKGLKFGSNTGFKTAVLRRKIQEQFRRLTQLPDFNVYLNEEEIKPSAIEKATKFNVDMEGKHMGRVTGTVYLTGVKTDMRGIHIAVKGRTHGNPQEILNKLIDRTTMRGRIIGDIDADGLSEAVLIDRDTFWEDHKGYQEFLIQMKTFVNKIDRYERKHQERTRGSALKRARGDMLKFVHKKMRASNIPGVTSETHFKFGDPKNSVGLSCDYDIHSDTFVFFDGVGKMDVEICTDKTRYQQAMLDAAIESIATQETLNSTGDTLDAFIEARDDLWKRLKGKRKENATKTNIYPEMIYTVAELASNSNLPIGVIRYMDDAGLFERVEKGIIGESFRDVIYNTKGFISLYGLLHGMVLPNLAQTMDRLTDFFEDMGGEIKPFVVDFATARRHDHCYFIEGACQTLFEGIVSGNVNSRATRNKMRRSVMNLRTKSYSKEELVNMSDRMNPSEVRRVLEYAKERGIEIRKGRAYSYPKFIDALQQKRIE